MSKFNYDECEEIDAIREDYLTLSCEELREERYRLYSQEKENKTRIQIINEILKDAVCDMENDY